MKTTVRIAAIIICGATLWGLPQTRLHAQSSVEAVVPVSEVQRQVFAALAASNATLEATKRQSDRALRRKLFEIEDLQLQINELEEESVTTADEIEALRNQLATEQQRFVEELTARDRVYADEIATYRRAVEDIAATPGGLIALERFNAGEEAEALATLDRLRAVRDLAAARRIAQLALDAWSRSQVSTQSVIDRYYELTQLDPLNFEDLHELGLLFIHADNIELAKDVSSDLASLATTETQEFLSDTFRGNIALTDSDFELAYRAFFASKKIAEGMLLLNPEDTELIINLFNSEINVATALLFRGDHQAAATGIERASDVAASLLSEDTDDLVHLQSAYALFDIVGSLQMERGNFTDALYAYNSGIRLVHKAVENNPENFFFQEDLARFYFLIGSARYEKDMFSASVTALARAARILESLVDADPTNNRQIFSLSQVYLRLALVHLEHNQSALAKDYLLKALDTNSFIALQDVSPAAQEQREAILEAISYLESALK